MQASSKRFVLGAACGLLLGYAMSRVYTRPTLENLATEESQGKDPVDSSSTAAQQAGQPQGLPRVCLVTGGSRGIGACICEKLASQGYKIAVNYSGSKAKALEVVARIRASGGEAIAVHCDVGNEEQVARMFDETEAKLGRLTACVNNAGILNSSSLMETSTEELKRVFRVNVFGPFFVLKEAVRRMGVSRGGKGGAVVNVSSGSAFIGKPVAYGMSKAALNSMSQGSIGELAQEGIRLNSVSPGPTATDMLANLNVAGAFNIPMGRLGQPMEIANAVAWFLSDDASYCSGANIRIAGGKPMGGSQ